MHEKRACQSSGTIWQSKIATGCGRSSALIPSIRRKGINRLIEFSMRAHRQRMDARIGAASGVQNGVFAGHFGNCILNRLLHRRTMRLPLPAHIGAAVKFDREGKAGHVRRVPGGMDLPRRKSAIGMAGFPAR